MKKTICTVLVALLVGVTLTVALCGCNATPKNVFGDLPEASYPTTLAFAGELNGATWVSSSGQLSVFTIDDVSGNPNYAVYSLRSGTLLNAFSAKTVNIDVGNSEGAVYSVTDAVANSVSYFDSYGTPLAENVSTSTAIDIGSDHALIGENVYLLKDGKWDGVTYKTDMGWDSDVLNSDRSVSDNYYYTQTGNSIKIYDRKSLKLISVLNINKYAKAQTDEQRAFMLAEDKIVIQYEDVLAEDATRYDAIIGGNKVDLRHYIYNVKSGKIKEVKNYKYYINLAVAVEMLGNNNMFAKNVKNVMLANKIEGGSLSADSEIYVINGNLKVTKTLSDITYDISIAGGISKFGDGYIVSRNDGSGVIVNKNGKAISEVGSANIYGNYAEISGSIYTLSGNKMVLKANFDPNAFTIMSIANDYVLLREANMGNVYGCKVGENHTLIGNITDVNVGIKYYTVMDSTGRITVYSLAGNKLGEGYTTFIPVTSSIDENGNVRVLVRVDLGYALLA